MTTVTFRLPRGTAVTVDATPGSSVMRTAVDNAVDGIVGECGGSLMCATCHVYVADDNQAVLPPLSDDEDGMLDFAAAPREEQSRLSCQLVIRDDDPGFVVVVPEEQV